MKRVVAYIIACACGNSDIHVSQEEDSSGVPYLRMKQGDDEIHTGLVGVRKLHIALGEVIVQMEAAEAPLA